jgi:hypothetical protein
MDNGDSLLAMAVASLENCPALRLPDRWYPKARRFPWGHGGIGAFRSSTGWLWAEAAVVVELGGSRAGDFRTLGLGWAAGGLGMLTLVALLAANDFWRETVTIDS